MHLPFCATSVTALPTPTVSESNCFQNVLHDEGQFAVPKARSVHATRGMSPWHLVVRLSHTTLLYTGEPQLTPLSMKCALQRATSVAHDSHEPIAWQHSPNRSQI